MMPAGIADAEFLCVTTYRRDGTPVPTPVWHAVDGEVVYTTTLADSGKVKRIRNNPRVTIAACDKAGRLTGPEHAGVATILLGDGHRRAVRIKEARHHLARLVHFYETRLRRHPMVGVEIRLS